MDKLALLILGFDENYIPSTEEISKAFKKAAKLFHPDTETGSGELFRGLKLAKERLESEVSNHSSNSSSNTSPYYYSYNNNSKYNYATPKPEPNIYEEMIKVYLKYYSELFDRFNINLKTFEIRNEEGTAIVKIIKEVKESNNYKASYKSSYCEQGYSVLHYLWLRDIVIIKKKGIEINGYKVKAEYYDSRFSLWFHRFWNT